MAVPRKIPVPAGRVDQVTDPDLLRRLVLLAGALQACVDREAVGAAMLPHGLDLLGAYGGVLAIVDADRCHLDVSISGYPTELRTRYPNVALDAPLPLAECVRIGEGLYFDNRDEVLTAYPGIEVTARTVSVCAVPLLRGAGALGALGLSYDVPVTFDAEVRAFLAVAAEQVAAAVARTSSWSALTVPTQDHPARRFADDR